MISHKRIQLKGLQAASFQHPLDQEATRTLSKLKGIDFIIKKIMESGVEWAFRFQKLSSAIRVSPCQFPAIHAIHTEACHILDIPPVELFIEQNPVLNAYTAGYTRPAIVVTSGLIDSLNEGELMFVLGHELGHQKCGHTFYHFMAQNLATFISILGQSTFGIGEQLGRIFVMELMEWSRKSEFSADRAGLLVAQNREDALRALGKLAVGSRKIADEINLEELIEQAKEFEELESGLTGQFWRFFMGMDGGTHPWLMFRVKEAAVWAEGTLPSFLEPFREVEASPKALTKKLSHAKAYNNRGNARMAAGDREGALSDYNQALALDPNYAPAYYNRGLFRYQLGEREDALSDYNQAIAIEPSNALAYYNRGIIRYELGDKSGALTDYSQGIALNPTLTLAYYNRGITHYYLGEREAAVEDLSRAIALDSTYAPAYYNRANVRSHLGDVEGASADFQKAADLYREQGNEESYKGALERLGKLREECT